jgi:chromosome segregation ATPase
MLEQLEQKILSTVTALQEARKDNKALQETTEELNNTIAELRQAVSDAEQRLQHRDTAITALQQQYESVKRENTRLSQEKNDWEVKVSALMEAIDETGFELESPSFESRSEAGVA